MLILGVTKNQALQKGVSMSYNLEELKILVVEDNQPMLELVKSILETFGVGQVYTAKEGEMGFKVFCRENTDMVITDWMMKPVNGLELTQMIRNDPLSPNPYVPVIMMTGFSEHKRVTGARDLGTTEFLVKPFKAEDMYKRLVQVVERPRQFVQCESFFGPDRRRAKTNDYDGAERRSDT